MKQRFWVFKRRNIYYLQDSETGKQESLHTSDKREAQRLHAAKNESVQQSMLNLALGKTYLSAHDPSLINRTWNEVMDVFCSQKSQPSQERNQREMESKPYDLIRNKRIVETTSDDFLQVLRAGGISTNHFLRRLQNLARGLGWLPWIILETNFWPKAKSKPKRAITWEEHNKIISSESNPERKLYYDLLWEIGAAQTDTAGLYAENIDWKTGTLSYKRKKTQEWAHLRIGENLEHLLRGLPEKGPLFPHLITTEASDRSSEFYRRCRLLEIKGISLHSYRYAWAERANAAGYEERWAMAALGHNSRAVHHAYAKKAKVTCPSLEYYEKKIIRMIPEKAADEGTLALK